MKKLKTLLFFVLSITALCGITSSYADEMSPQQSINNIFTKIARDTTPAVVYIKAELLPSTDIQPTQSPLDLFNEELFERFFGPQHPRNQQRQQQAPKQYSQGSGFLVTNDGYILTNNHVVNRTSSLTVTLVDGNEYDAKIIGVDPTTDLAVIKISANKELPFLSLGNSDSLQVGEWVLAIGNPLGFQTSVSAGIVSAKNRGNLNLVSYEDFIQTDAAINMGNSGGPLVNIDGKVIGVNAALASTNGGYIGIGFAIPSTMAKTVMMQIIETGTVAHGFLGVTLQDITSDLAAAFKLDNVKGALITDVVKDCAAAKAGIERGDIVIAYDGTVVENIHTFRYAIALMEPGTKTTLTINRNGELQDIVVIVGAHPSKNIATSEMSISQKIGIDVEPLTNEIAQQMGYIDEKGVIISKVTPQSPAEMTGIRRGALVLSVNNIKVSSPKEFYDALEKSPEGKVLLFIKQGAVMRYVTIKIK